MCIKMDYFNFFEIFVLIFKIYCYISISLLSLYLYKTFFLSKYKPNSNYYYRREWYHILKVLWAKPYVNKYKNTFHKTIKKETSASIEQPRKLTTFMRYDSQSIYGVDHKGNCIFIKISLRENRLAELCFQMKLVDGKIYQLPEHPSVLVCSIPERKWYAGGLGIDIIEPFEKLRIYFNGLLRNCVRSHCKEETGDVVHCKFSFIWSAAGEPKYFPQDTTTNELANAVAVEPWKNSKWIQLLGHQTGYDQYGMLLGQIFFEPNTPPIVLRLTSGRKRTWGPSKTRTLHRTLTLFGVQSNGSIFTINVKSYIRGCKELQTGSMILPNRKVIPIEECDISLPDFVENGIIPGAFSFSFQANGVFYDCTAFTCQNKITKLTNNEFKGYKSKLCETKYMINGEEAIGYGLFWYRHQGKNQTLPPYIIRPGVQIVEPERKYVASFTSPECKSEYLAGIKGTALSLLTTVDTVKFDLLDGFCVLVPAFQQHLERNPNLNDEINKLKNICSDLTNKKLSEVCNRIKSLFAETELFQELQEDITNELQLLKFKSTDIEAEETKYCWAVRLSTVDEDVAKIPLLRNQSYLDCFSNDDVFKAVLSCWNSVFTPEKVLYRKSRGLPIICNMAVIIQYAINSDISGDLSTCHPKTADPSEIIITANYGLGISVVTNMVEPDIASVIRTWDGKLNILHTSIGEKKHKNVLSHTGVKQIENNNRKILCLTYEQILKIAEVGILLEKSFGDPRNIEWALFKDQLYILNIKPIRFQYDWTTFDLIHENDTAILNKHDLTIVNSTQNLLTGVSSNLTLSLCVKYLDDSLKSIYSRTDNLKGFVLKVLTVYKQQVGVNVFKSILRHVDKDITEELKIHELVSTGQSFINEELHQKSIEINSISKLPNTIINYLRTLSYCWHSSEYMEEAKILSHAIRIISYNEFSAFEYFNVIKRNLHLLRRVIDLYTFVNYSNISYQKLLLNLMQDDKQEVSTEQFFEMIDTYSQNSVYDMSTKVELMAVFIKNKNLNDDFCKLNPSEALVWLEEKCKDVMVLFKKYMKKYGHRAVNEIDLKSIPWEINTLALIRILQILVHKLEKNESNNEPVEKRKRTLSIRQRLNGRILRWIELKVENSFIYKEKTLSSLAKTVNKFRFAYRELAKKIVEEGKLPNTELIFYLTQRELEQLINRKNPDLVKKAMKRMNLGSELEQNNIPDFCTKEHVVPKGNSDEVDDVLMIPSRIIGSSVVSGHVKARAYVVENIPQVNDIQAGDILVTKNLDIAWSPYFPILSGIVTENGCLTSQGAISVRKRNIPCITNASNATNIYKTGDVLSLIANNGVIEKIEDVKTT